MHAIVAIAARLSFRRTRESKLASQVTRNMASASAAMFDTIIIGAGMAGLACASKLLDDSTYGDSPGPHIKRKTLAVLEARDRIGGRIASIHVNGARLDTGANWIHGVGSKGGPLGVNPLVEILPHKKFRELGSNVSFRASRNAGGSVGSICTREDEGDEDWVHVDNAVKMQHERHDLVIPAKYSAIMHHALWALIGSLHERAATTKADEAKSISLLQAIVDDEGFRKAFDSIPLEYHETLQALPQFIENMEAGPLAATIENRKAGLGLLEFAIEDFDGEQVFLRDGYTAVVEEVGKKIVEQGHLKLGIEIEQIDWAGELVRVRTTDGTTYDAKRVICTLPLGVLQHHLSNVQSPALFQPALPRDKVEAVQSLGFGTLDKIFLVYNEAWWTTASWQDVLKRGMTEQAFPEDLDKNVDNAEGRKVEEPDILGGPTEELPGLAIDSDGKILAGPRFLSLINLHALTGFPVLSCFVSCANALRIEAMSDSEAGSIVHRSLAKWLGREPPVADAIHVTRWAKDAYSRGSYSHMITGLSETRHRQVCGRPVVGPKGVVVRFAGEHTSHNHFATVHGALLSGWREAAAILAEEG